MQFTDLKTHSLQTVHTFCRSVRSLRIDKPYITTLAMKIFEVPLMRCDLRTVKHTLQTAHTFCRSVRSVRIDTWLIRTVTVRVYWTTLYRLRLHVWALAWFKNPFYKLKVENTKYLTATSIYVGFNFSFHCF